MLKPTYGHLVASYNFARLASTSADISSRIDSANQPRILLTGNLTATRMGFFIHQESELKFHKIFSVPSNVITIGMWVKPHFHE